MSEYGKRDWIADKIQRALDNPDYHGGTLYPVNLTPAGWREVLNALQSEYVGMTWQQEALAKLGYMRDSMPPEHVEIVQSFISGSSR